MTVTIDQILEWGPVCVGYGREGLEALFTGREEISAEDIPALNLSADHKVWFLLNFLSERQLHILACVWAEEVSHLTCNEASAAIAAKRAWLRGEITDVELNAKAIEVQEAIWDIDEDVAWFACAAARAAVKDDAWLAAEEASAHANSAMPSRPQQINRILKIIKEAI